MKTGNAGDQFHVEVFSSFEVPALKGYWQMLSINLMVEVIKWQDC